MLWRRDVNMERKDKAPLLRETDEAPYSKNIIPVLKKKLLED
jgi:hypothetical protein